MREMLFESMVMVMFLILAGFSRLSATNVSLSTRPCARSFSGVPRPPVTNRRVSAAGALGHSGTMGRAPDTATAEGREPDSYRSDPDVPDFTDYRPVIVFDGRLLG